MAMLDILRHYFPSRIEIINFRLPYIGIFLSNGREKYVPEHHLVQVNDNQNRYLVCSRVPAVNANYSHLLDITEPE